MDNIAVVTFIIVNGNGTLNIETSDWKPPVEFTIEDVVGEALRDFMVRNINYVSEVFAYSVTMGTSNIARTDLVKLPAAADRKEVEKAVSSVIPELKTNNSTSYKRAISTFLQSKKLFPAPIENSRYIIFSDNITVH